MVLVNGGERCKTGDNTLVLGAVLSAVANCRSERSYALEAH